MAVDLNQLVAPGHTVLVTQECQNGIVGEHSPLLPLVEASRVPMQVAGRLCAAARAAGVPVVHCLFLRRPDGLAASTNSRLFSSSLKTGVRTHTGSVEAEVVPELGVDERDIILGRFHGLGPMGGTDLAMVCRNLGATTIVGVGASVNVGMLSLGLDAVNEGFQFVLPRDAVAGVPPAYADTVIDNSFKVFGTIVSADEVVDVWKVA